MAAEVPTRKIPKAQSLLNINLTSKEFYASLMFLATIAGHFKIFTSYLLLQSKKADAIFNYKFQEKITVELVTFDSFGLAMFSHNVSPQ